MNPYSPQVSWQNRMFGTIALPAGRAALVKQSYLLLSVSVLAAMAGGYIGATSPFVLSLFTSWIGVILALIVLNAVPYIALAARHNPVLGVSALVLDGFISGIVISPLLYVASQFAPGLIWAAFGITALVFLAVTAYVMTTSRTFSAPRGLMLGLSVAIFGAIMLNMFLNIGLLGILISAAIGVFGVLVLVYATSDLLSNPAIDSPIPAALTLFASLFNIFVATLNLLLRFGQSSRD